MSTVDELALEVIRLRRELDEVRTELRAHHAELAALHDGSATLHVGYVLVGDLERPGGVGRRVEINPGSIGIDNDTKGCRINLATYSDGTVEVCLSAGDTGFQRGEHVQTVSLVATTDWAFNDGGPRAYVDVTSDDPHVLIYRFGDDGFVGPRIDLSPEIAHTAS